MTPCATLIEQARDALGRDPARAASLAAELRQHVPDSPEGYQIGAAAAREWRRFDEAATILSAARVRFPTYAWPVAEAAWTAHSGGDAAEAMRLAAELRDRFPDVPAGYHAGSAAARDLRLFDESATILASGRARFPDEPWPISEAAWTAHARGDFVEARRRAAELRERFPNIVTGYQIGALLPRDGDLAEVDAMLREAMARFPQESWPIHEVVGASRKRANRRDAASLTRMLAIRTDAIATSVSQGPAVGKVVVVLGMHRAGTSLCTTIIQRLGISLGAPLTPPGFDNPDGFQEHARIVECHRLLLAALDADWDTVRLIAPPPPGFWRDAAAMPIRDQLRRVVLEQVAAAGGTWAFKDPRTMLFLPLWREIFDEIGVRPIWIVSVRDPRAVAASLFARDSIPLDVGEMLWVEHYLSALREIGPRIAGIVHYEQWFSNPEAQIKQLATSIGVVADDATTNHAKEAIRADRRHDGPSLGNAALELAGIVHSWLSGNTQDLTRLERGAEAAWRDVEAVWRSRGV
jgi:hypothetical protein